MKRTPKAPAPPPLPKPKDAYQLAGQKAPKVGVPKPHIRMRKLKTSGGTAFPTAAAAFPTDPGADPAATPDQALAGPAMGAGPGVMGE